MAKYVTIEPINIKFILDYIKTNHGDSVYNTVINYKGSVGDGRRSVDMSLKQLMEYANEHNGYLPNNFWVTLAIEYNNSGNMTGNFKINILQLYTSAANIDPSKCRPYFVSYVSGNTIYYNCVAGYNSSSTWNIFGIPQVKNLAIGCTGTSSTKTVQYVNPDNGIGRWNYYYTPDFTQSSLAVITEYECFPGTNSYNNSHPNIKIWFTMPIYTNRVNSSTQTYPLIAAEKGVPVDGVYNLTPAEEQRYIDYSAPLVMMEETQPYDGINCFDLSFSGMTYVAERHQYEAGMFVRLLDEASTHSKVIFTNETIGKAYDQVSYAKPISVPDEVFEKPGLIRADVYGTGTSASTVQKQFYFKVKENPSTRTTLSNLTMGTNIKPFRVRNSNRIEFLWAHTGSSNPAIEIIDDDMMVKYMDIWNDSNPNVKYQISPTNNKFPIPLSYFDLKGTFHGLLRCGNNKVDSVVTEFIWNFE